MLHATCPFLLPPLYPSTPPPSCNFCRSRRTDQNRLKIRPRTPPGVHPTQFFILGSIFEDPGARRRPPGAENDEKSRRRKKSARKVARSLVLLRPSSPARSLPLPRLIHKKSNGCAACTCGAATTLMGATRELPVHGGKIILRRLLTEIAPVATTCNFRCEDVSCDSPMAAATEAQGFADQANGQADTDPVPNSRLRSRRRGGGDGTDDDDGDGGDMMTVGVLMMTVMLVCLRSSP